ncbi:MAG: CorA family divalent cation transporter, partial [bacterium]
TIIENKQAIEMAKIYTNILAGTRDAFASIISNNLNIVMKRLTSITIIMALPTIISSFFGMNVVVPLEGVEYAFEFICLISVLICIVISRIMIKKNMF